MSAEKKKILLTGGGTGGSVAPLLAIADVIDKDSYDLCFVGTRFGIERTMVRDMGIDYMYVRVGKLRRYFSLKNVLDIFEVLIGFFQSMKIMYKQKPDIVLSAGSYVAVPVVLAAAVFKIPCVVHQMDIRPGLANKIMARVATLVTVTFEKSLNDYGKKTLWTGNPVREKMSNIDISKEEALFDFGFTIDMPVVLIVGGGTGSSGINDVIEEAILQLTEISQVIHITGKNKQTNSMKFLKNDNYKVFEFLDVDRMTYALKASSVVVTRCGMGLLTELAMLKKPSILIPMSESHQEDNAQIFKEANAAIVIDQGDLNEESLIINIKAILGNANLREVMKINVGNIFKTDASATYLGIIKKIIG